jgi:hypothetical protein
MFYNSSNACMQRLATRDFDGGRSVLLQMPSNHVPRGPNPTLVHTPSQPTSMVVADTTYNRQNASLRCDFPHIPLRNHIHPSGIKYAPVPEASNKKSRRYAFCGDAEFTNGTSGRPTSLPGVPCARRGRRLAYVPAMLRNATQHCCGSLSPMKRSTLSGDGAKHGYLMLRYGISRMTAI